MDTPEASDSCCPSDSTHASVDAIPIPLNEDGFPDFSDEVDDLVKMVWGDGDSEPVLCDDGGNVPVLCDDGDDEPVLCDDGADEPVLCDACDDEPVQGDETDYDLVLCSMICRCPECVAKGLVDLTSEDTPTLSTSDGLIPSAKRGGQKLATKENAKKRVGHAQPVGKPTKRVMGKSTMVHGPICLASAR